jgi:hypothetical protein
MMVGRRPRSGLDKLVRLGVMAEVLLTEVRRAPLDEAALLRLREAQEAVRRELGDCLSPRLEEELGRLTPPVVGGPPSAGELRVAQAELVGWLEGLTAAVQSVMVAKLARRARDGQGHG